MRRFEDGRARVPMNYEFKRIVDRKTVIETFTAYDDGQAIREAFRRLGIRSRSLELFRNAGGVALYRVPADGSTKEQIFPRLH